MQYNLIRNASFSGSGDIDFSYSDLVLLQDGNTTSSGVVVSGTSSLIVDFSQRIKVDGINLYADDLSQSDNIYFYYKNSETDEYTQLTTYSGAYYYTTVSSPSAPQFVKVTTSGIVITFYEFEIFNNDYIVNFGEDGGVYAEYLDDAPIGEEGDAQAIAIYNNGTSNLPANAYTCVEYAGEDADNYIKISSSMDGIYYDLEDGVFLQDDLSTSEYIWSMGTFDDTEVSDNKVIISSDPGVYTTPIFEVEDPNFSSYFYIEGDTSVSGSSISYDPDVYNGTIRVRSSNTELVPIYSSYISYISSKNNYAYEWSQYDDSTSDHFVFYNYLAHEPMICDVSLDGQRVCISSSYDTGSRNSLVVADMNGTELGSIGSLTDYLYYFNDIVKFEGENGAWAYGNIDDVNNRILYHLDVDLSILYEYSEYQQDFLYDLCTENNGRGCWYTNSLDDTLVHMASNGAKSQTLYLNSPTYVASTTDNGVWVTTNVWYDDIGYAITFVRYDSLGNQISSILVPYNDIYGSRGVSRIDSDLRDGVWCMYGDYISHITSEGINDVGPVFIADPFRLRGTPIGCFVYSDDDNLMYWVDMNGNTTSKSVPANEGIYGFGLFYHGYEEHKSDHTDSLPLSYDPVWGTGGSAEWKEVAKDGYFLPRNKYHQVEITLRGDAELEKVIMAPTIKTEDVSINQSRNIYIKTNIPYGIDVTDYEVKLRTWWGVDE